MSESDRRGLTRRRFLQGLGVGAIAAGALPSTSGAAPPAREEEADPRVLGPGPVKISFDVDGVRREVEAEPRTTLLDALRNRLGVTAPKKVCDRATCGACTVLLDGKPVYACSVLAVAAAGRRIETAEGLAAGGLNDIQRAFVEHDAQQCGFCTPGFVAACEGALRATGGRLDERDLPRLLGGNLCRCGTYVGIRGALLETARRRREKER